MALTPWPPDQARGRLLLTGAPPADIEALRRWHRAHVRVRAFATIGMTIALFTLIAAVLPGRPAAAQVAACGSRDEIVAALERNFGERPVGRGLASGGAMLEVLAAQGGSFTVLLTRPNGVSCLVTTGEYWENVPAPPARVGGGES